MIVSHVARTHTHKCCPELSATRWPRADEDGVRHMFHTATCAKVVHLCDVIADGAILHMPTGDEVGGLSESARYTTSRL